MGYQLVQLLIGHLKKEIGKATCDFQYQIESQTEPKLPFEPLQILYCHHI